VPRGPASTTARLCLSQQSCRGAACRQCTRTLFVNSLTTGKQSKTWAAPTQRGDWWQLAGELHWSSPLSSSLMNTLVVICIAFTRINAFLVVYHPRAADGRGDCGNWPRSGKPQLALIAQPASNQATARGFVAAQPHGLQRYVRYRHHFAPTIPRGKEKILSFLRVRRGQKTQLGVGSLPLLRNRSSPHSAPSVCCPPRWLF
jgi:hypothetical protein